MLKDFTKERFDIILQAGQSNAEGYGCGPVEKPYQPKDTVWYMDGDFTMTKAAERVWLNEIHGHFGLSFADCYIKDGLLENGRKLLILRCAVGSTGFADHRWGLTDDLYLRMLEMVRTALALNPENRLVAMLWHQGETDVKSKVTYETHYENLSGLLASVRKELDLPNLPFIAADFVPSWRDKYAQVCNPVIRAMRDVCQNFEHATFVETDGLLCNFEKMERPTAGWVDGIHFCRESQYELGHRYYDAFLTLKNNG